MMKLAEKITTKARVFFINALNNLKGIAGLHAQTFINAKGAAIITYHGICIKDHLRFNTLFITAETFETHLKFYRKYFHVLSIDDFYEERFHNEKFNVCITFDDGFYNNYKYALPLLKKYSTPATFFITAIREAGYDILWNDYLSVLSKHKDGNLVFKNEVFYKDRFGKYISQTQKISLAEKLKNTGFEEKKEFMNINSDASIFKNEKEFWLQMSQQEIKELSECKLFTIGAHGYYHNDLVQISINDAIAEMKNSKKFLEKVTEQRINAIAFPYGSYSPYLINEAIKQGYNQLLVLDFNSAADEKNKSIRKRMVVNPYSSVHNQMLAIINGKYA